MHLRLGSSELRAQLVRGGIGSIVLKVANVGLGLGLAVVLARSLGAEGYGIYSYIFALVGLLGIPAQFGLPGLVVRETAKAQANQDWGVMRGLWWWAGISTVVLSVLLAALGGGIAWALADHFTSLQLVTFGWGLVLIPLVALGSLRGAALRGLRKVVLGQLPEYVIRPALLICFILALSVWGAGTVNASQAMALHALAAAIAFFFGAWLLRRERPAALITEQSTPIYETRRWFASVLPFALIAGMSLLNTQIDVLMLGVFATAQDVGIYRVAAQGATLVALGLTAVEMVSRPYFARFHALGDMRGFQKLATASACASLLAALPAALIFALFGTTILQMFFGPEYGSGYSALVILSAAQVIRGGCGAVGLLLSMSGHEVDTAKIFAASAVCNIILNAILIPLYGMMGAAFATGASIFFRTILLWLIVRQRLGVDSSVFWLIWKYDRVR